MGLIGVPEIMLIVPMLFVIHKSASTLIVPIA